MELIEYDFGPNYKSWMKEDDAGVGYLAEGRDALSCYLSDVDDVDNLISKMNKNYSEKDAYCRVKVFEHGVLLSFYDAIENYKWGDYDPVTAYAFIFDSGEIHYVITHYAIHYGGNGEIYSTLLDRLGNQVCYVDEKTGLAEKIQKTKNLNMEIKQTREAKAKTVLENIRQLLNAEDKDFNPEDKLVIEMADFLNKNVELVQIEDMKMILRNVFPGAKESLFDAAIIKHLDYTGKIYSFNKKITEIQEQVEKKQKKKSA